jgi:transposase
MEIDIAKASREDLIKYVSVLRETTFTQQSKIEVLEARVAWFKRQLFGQKTERLIPQDPRQATLFEIPETPPSESTTIRSYERSVRKNPTEVSDEGGVRFDVSVPVDEEVILPKEVKGLGADAYEVIGEKVTERLVQIPTQYRVKRTIRKTVKIKETATLYTAPAPEGVIERSFADVTFLAGMVTDKFLYHLPLYRQHQRMESSGVHISRGHLSKLTHRTLELLEPIYYAVLSSVISSDLVCMDETPIKASRQEKGKMHQAYFWPIFAEQEVVFVYEDSRKHEVVPKLLKDKCKKLLSDGYAAYDRYAESRKDLVHAQCWAHVRRKFFDAKQHSPPECERVLEMIRALFKIEQGLSASREEEILRVRREESFPVVEQFFDYLDSLWFDHMVEKGSSLGTAVAYARSREKELRQFLSHPDIPISNNHVERAIRPVALGRKNWLFCWTEVGAKYAAIAYTLIECCKLHRIDPWTYLVDVLQRLDSHPARDVHLLTPKHWKQLIQPNVKNTA